MVKTQDGKHYVIIGGVKRGPYESNSKAWREHDRIMCEPISKSEHTSDWAFSKAASNE